MDLDELRAFASAARRGSLTSASRELGLSQPSLSRIVQRLERELGVALLARQGRSISLTPAGDRFLRWAESTLERYQAMRAELVRPPDDVVGPLRLAASTIPGEFLVPRLVSSFAAAFPAVRAAVDIVDSEEVLRRLSAERAEVGFAGLCPDDRRFAREVVGHDEVVLVVPPDHRFARRGRIGVHELEGERVVEREAGSGTRATFEAALARSRLAPPRFRTAMVLGSTEAVVTAVQEGYGVGLVSSLALAGRSPGRAAVVRIRGLPLRRSLCMLTLRGRSLPPPAARFVDWVRRQQGPGSP